MAYLRGNTYVDGALNVEGSLIIDSVASSSGNVPFYIDTGVKSKVDSIIKVNDSDGAITSTDIYATRALTQIKTDTQDGISQGVYLGYSLPGDGSKIYIDNELSHRDGVASTVFRLDPATMKWNFYDLKVDVDGNITGSEIIGDII